MAQDGDNDRKDAQPNHCFTPVFETRHLFGFDIEVGFAFGHVARKQPRGQQPTGDRRNEEKEKVDELPFARGPGHQGRNVAEGTPGTSRVGGDDDVDGTGDQEMGLGLVDRKEDRREDQRRGEVVGDRRDEKGEQSSQPKELFVAVAPGDQLVFEHVKNPPFDQRLDVGHRHEEEEEDFGDLQNQLLHLLVHRRGIHVVERKEDADEHKHKGTGKKGRFGFVDLILLFGGDEVVGDDEDGQVDDTHPRGGQMESGFMHGVPFRF